MSLWDSINLAWNKFNAATSGVFVQGITGNLDPWSYNVNVLEFKQSYIQIYPNAAQSQIDAAVADYATQLKGFLAQTNSLPGGCYLRIPFVGCVWSPSGGEAATAVPTALAKAQNALDDLFFVLEIVVALLALVAVVYVYSLLKQAGVVRQLGKAFK